MRFEIILGTAAAVVAAKGPSTHTRVTTQHSPQIPMCFESSGVVVPNGMSIAAASRRVLLRHCCGCQTLDLIEGHFSGWRGGTLEYGIRPNLIGIC